ncbi:MAG: membrane protein insertase YidC [Spirochaetia bacterium]|jgi:YidC/Oxa1 family membrane protein insertase|nr:membrane protein insertase YidC [Spirochaetia bacterium]
MKKETVIAILLVCVVWVIYFAFQAKYNPTDNQQQTDDPAKTEQGQQTAQQPPQTPQTDGAASSAAIAANRNPNLKEEIIPFTAGRFKGEFNSKGAVISQMYLSGLTEGDALVTVPDSGFQAKGVFDFPVYFTTNEFLYGSDLDKAVWRVDSKSDTDVIFSINISLNGTPLEIKKHYKLNGKEYSFDVEYTFINRGYADISLPQLIVSPADLVGPKLDYKNRYNLLGGISSVNGSYEHMEKSGSDILKRKQGSVDWTGVASRYILLIMMPAGQNAIEALMDNREHYGYRTGMLMPSDTIKRGSSTAKLFTVYVGPKDKDSLAAIDQRLKSAYDIMMIIEPIRYFVIWCLLGLNKLFGNIGWSLVVFSLLTKLVFLPLTKKSTDSMKKIQLLTPQVTAIKAKYKDKPDVMQREIMALYKENKINPLGGCLPILLQMPFFFALYSALINSIDLWNAPFILWMKDLSMPDTVAAISGFNVNILPVIMVVSTFFQTKLSTIDTGQSKQQKIMMMAMPVVFIFIFWTMPSGLVLYWIMQNVLQIANQLIVNKFGKVK